MKRMAFKALIAGALCWAGLAEAALIDRGNGLIYDTTLNVTWMADMNYAYTTGHTWNGEMTRTQALSWASDLEYGGFSDWRLPTLNPYDTTCSGNSGEGQPFQTIYYGDNCTGGELSHLFVVDLGNIFNGSPENTDPVQLANRALFFNISSEIYWSSTVFDYDPTGSFIFYTGGMFQAMVAVGNSGLYAVAVRDGDVANQVDEPSSMLMILPALVAVLYGRGRKTIDNDVAARMVTRRNRRQDASR